MRLTGSTRSHLFVPYDEKFRNAAVSVGRSGIVYKTIWENPYQTYVIITEQLQAGEYKFRLRTYDDMNNESSYSEETATVAAFQMPPRYFRGRADGNRVYLYWTHPTTGVPDRYVIYTNEGSGEVLRHYTYHELDNGETECTLEVDPGNWKFIIEAVTGSLLSRNEFTVSLTTPTSLAMPPNVLSTASKVVSVGLYNVSAGKVGVSFVWPYGSLARGFRMYHDNGTGTVNYGSYTYFDRQDGVFQKFVSPQIYSGKENREFKIVIRAVSQSNVVDNNEVVNRVILDGVAPEGLLEISAGTTY